MVQNLFSILFGSMKVPECLHSLSLIPLLFREIVGSKVGSKEDVPYVITVADDVASVSIKIWGKDFFSRPAKARIIKCSNDGSVRQKYSRDGGSNIIETGRRTALIGNNDFCKGAHISR